MVAHGNQPKQGDDNKQRNNRALDICIHEKQLRLLLDRCCLVHRGFRLLRGVVGRLLTLGGGCVVMLIAPAKVISTP